MRLRQAAGVALLLLGLSSAALGIDQRQGGPQTQPAGAWGGWLVPVSSAATAAPSSARPTLLRVPSIGFEARIREDATPPGDVVTPETYDDVSWLSAYGMPGGAATNTVYLAGHSSGVGATVFDALLTSRGTARDLSGETVIVQTKAGPVTYRFDGPARYYAKNQIARAADVWRVVPGRLLIVTCDQSRDDRNIVFTASLVSGHPRAVR